MNTRDAELQELERAIELLGRSTRPGRLRVGDRDTGRVELNVDDCLASEKLIATQK